ncbi:MAG: acyl-CoA reductase, partial [Planctomycetaceae bacterium]
PVLNDVLAQPGAAFLAEFLQPSALRRLVAREVPDPEMLSRFVTRGGERTAIRLVPRGLVCHWLAGNVPLLGALSWAVSVLVGNANLLRLSSQQDDFISPLLEALAGSGDSGETLASETSVVRFDRGDVAAHRAMSGAADVRIAWGGRESVEVVKSLPARWDCEDVILGPRISFAVVDPTTMTAGATRRLATDVVYFDQQACSSPQIVFVRRRADDAEFARFVSELSEEIARKSVAVPRRPLDHGETYRIALDRSRVLLAGGSVRRDDGTSWTVAVLAEPAPDVRCANRFVQVVPFGTFDDVLRHIPPNVQTIVTRLPAKDLETFTDAACVRGVCRFPAPGEGNRFETPWDGLPLVSRLTRWVTRTESAFETGDGLR